MLKLTKMLSTFMKNKNIRFFLNCICNTEIAMSMAEIIGSKCTVQLAIGTDLKTFYLISNHNKIFNAPRSCLERVLLLVTFINVSFHYQYHFSCLHYWTLTDYIISLPLNCNL